MPVSTTVQIASETGLTVLDVLRSVSPVLNGALLPDAYATLSATSIDAFGWYVMMHVECSAAFGSPFARYSARSLARAIVSGLSESVVGSTPCAFSSHSCIAASQSGLCASSSSSAAWLRRNSVNRASASWLIDIDCATLTRLVAMVSPNFFVFASACLQYTAFLAMFARRSAHATFRSFSIRSALRIISSSWCVPAAARSLMRNMAECFSQEAERSVVASGRSAPLIMMFY